jgi:hypothetical protein
MGARRGAWRGGVQVGIGLARRAATLVGVVTTLHAGAIAAQQGTGDARASGAPLWPMVAGTRYDWRGEVTWTPSGTPDTIRRPAQWTTTVHDVRTRAGRQVALMEGMPQAMLLAQGTVEPRWSVVASDARHVWLREAPTRAAADSTAAAWLAGATLLDDVLQLRLPAGVNDRWPEQAMKVADGFFEWTVTHVGDARAIAKVPVAAGARAYEVTMHTAPEMRVVTLVPGRGIVRWWHLHFGRTQRIVLELVAVRAPGAARPAQGRRRTVPSGIATP